MPTEPTRLRLELAYELARLRSTAKVGGRMMAGSLELSQASVSRIEAGRRIPSRVEAEAWLDTAQAEDPQRRRVLALLDAAHAETVRWRDALAGVGHLQDVIAETERAARLIRNWQPDAVPGLLQSREYAEHYMSLVDPRVGTDLGAAVDARMQRQRILLEPGRQFVFLVTEAGLERPVAPADVLAAQREQVRRLATLDGVRVAVVPERLVPIARTAFVLLEDVDDGHPYARIELAVGPHTITDPDDVAVYRSISAELEKAARPVGER